MSVARAYAKALYETASEAKLSADKIGQLETHMDEFVRMIDSSRDAQVVLQGPVASVKEKTSALDEIAKRASFEPLFIQFLHLLARKGRLSLIHEIRDSFSAVRLEAEGGVPGNLVSAEPMNASDIEGLTKAFAKKLGKRVAFRVSTDPTLLAGMKVTVSGVTYDGTLRAQLQRLRDQVVGGIQ